MRRGQACSGTTIAESHKLPIGEQALIPHQARRANGGAIQLAAGVPGAIRTAAGHLQCPAVVQAAADRSAENDDPDNGVAVIDGQRELVPRRRTVMSMMLSNETTCGVKANGLDRKRLGADTTAGNVRHARSLLVGTVPRQPPCRGEMPPPDPQEGAGAGTAPAQKGPRDE